MLEGRELVNTGILAGRLAADPQFDDQSGTPKCRFRLAVDAYNPATKTREADFLGLIAFGKTAEIIGKYCAKGSHVVVRFHLKPRQWNDAKTGERRYETSIVCDEIELGPRATTGRPENSSPNTGRGFVQSPAMPEIEDDLPF